MLKEPMNVMTDTLIEMLVAILADDIVLSENDAASVEQIQRELQRRSDERHRSFLSVN
jgi:hypothetical protein